MTDEPQPQPQPELTPTDTSEVPDTEGHSFVNPSVYGDLARERHRDLAREDDRTRAKKAAAEQKKRRWPFG